MLHCHILVGCEFAAQRKLFCSCVCKLFVFFKQKTVYEIRISDWSSDVCSSDLTAPATPGPRNGWPPPRRKRLAQLSRQPRDGHRTRRRPGADREIGRARVGKAWVSTGRSRWSLDLDKNKQLDDPNIHSIVIPINR